MKYIVPICAGILGGIFLAKAGYSPADGFFYAVMIPTGIIASAIGFAADGAMS